MNRSGAITFEPYSGGNNKSNTNADYGEEDEVLTSMGHGGHPVWKSLSALSSTGETRIRVFDIDNANNLIDFNYNNKTLRGLLVIVVGGGGSSGGLQAWSGNRVTYGAGAGAMNVYAYSSAQITEIIKNTRKCKIVIGAGGAAPAENQNGNTGGTSCFEPRNDNGNKMAAYDLCAAGGGGSGRAANANGSPAVGGYSGGGGTHSFRGDIGAPIGQGGRWSFGDYLASDDYKGGFGNAGDGQMARQGETETLPGLAGSPGGIITIETY